MAVRHQLVEHASKSEEVVRSASSTTASRAHSTPGFCPDACLSEASDAMLKSMRTARWSGIASMMLAGLRSRWKRPSMGPLPCRHQAVVLLLVEVALSKLSSVARTRCCRGAARSGRREARDRFA